MIRRPGEDQGYSKLVDEFYAHRFVLRICTRKCKGISCPTLASMIDFTKCEQDTAEGGLFLLAISGRWNSHTNLQIIVFAKVPKNERPHPH